MFDGGIQVEINLPVVYMHTAVWDFADVLTSIIIIESKFKNCSKGIEFC